MGRDRGSRVGRQDDQVLPAVPSAARRYLEPPLAYDVERVLRTALVGPDEPGVDVGLDILDAGDDEPDARTVRQSIQWHRHRGRRESGRHRPPTMARYARSRLVADLAVSFAVAAVGSALPPAGGIGVPVLLLPPALVVSLGLSGAYERRVLLAGLAEYGRVVRGGLGLLAAAVAAAVLVPVTLPLSYVLGVLPAVTIGAVAGRILLRRRRRPGNSWLS
jgi:hypothetical protein